MEKQILETVRDSVISFFQDDKKKLTEAELTILEDIFFKHLEEMWGGAEILEEDKFSSNDIFNHPLEVRYLLLCYPVELKKVLQEPQKDMEYWDFLDENFPDFTNLQEFYEFLEGNEIEF